MAIDVSKQVAKADQAASQKKYELAIEIYLQALAIDPDNRSGRRGIRMAAFRQHEINPASGFSQKMQLAAAKAKLLHPNLDQRIQALEGYLKVDPKNLDLCLQLADTCEKAKYPNGAIGVLEGVAEIHPKDPESRTHLGRLLGSKEPQKALEHLERALQLEPRNQTAIKLRKDLAAEMSIRRTGFETAKTTHDLLRNKDQMKELLQAERIQLDADSSADAISRIETRLRAAPEDKKLLREYARQLASAGRSEDAKKAWQRLIQVDPTDFDARVQLGDLRIAEVDRALASAESRRDAAAVAAAKRRRVEIVIEEFQARVAEHPTDLALRFSLGDAFREAGRVDDAIGEFQKAVKDPRNRVDALCLLGECFLDKGLFELAARQLEKALEESPGLNSERGKQIVYNLGVLRERQGQHDAARGEFLKVYEVDVGYRDVADKVTALSRKPS